MATRKKKVPAKVAGKELDTLEARLLARVQAQQETIKDDGSNIIKPTAKGFQYQGSDLGMELDVVILGSVFENTYYDTPYDPDNITDPVCWAIGQDTRLMGPSEELKTRVSPRCNGCPMNEFESAPNGKGKACRNGRRIAVVPWVDGEPDMADIAILRIAPTSLNNYSKYVNRIYRHLNKDPIQIVTQFAIDETEMYGKIKIPTVVENIEDKGIVGQLMAMPAEMVLNDVPHSMTPTPAPEKAQPKRRAARSRV